MRSTMLQIDGQKLANLIKALGKTNTEIGRELGYSDSFMSMCISKNRIAKSAAHALEKTYGISVDAYKKAEEMEQVTYLVKAPQEATDSPKSDLMENLEEIIYCAVKRALKEQNAAPLPERMTEVAVDKQN